MWGRHYSKYFNLSISLNRLVYPFNRCVTADVRLKWLAKVMSLCLNGFSGSFLSHAVTLSPGPLKELPPPFSCAINIDSWCRCNLQSARPQKGVEGLACGDRSWIPVPQHQALCSSPCPGGGLLPTFLRSSVICRWVRVKSRKPGARLLLLNLPHSPSCAHRVSPTALSFLLPFLGKFHWS